MSPRNLLLPDARGQSEDRFLQHAWPERRKSSKSSTWRHKRLTFPLSAANVPPMRLTSSAIALACALFLLHPAHAGPASSQDDEFDKLLAERGLIKQISQVSQNAREKATDLVISAMGFLGVPYRRGGTSADTGFDCSGFVRAMYQQTIGLLLPRTANQQAAATQQIDESELKPGDLVFFNTLRRTFSHVGIYVGDNKFIHSPRPGAQVRVEDMRIGYWQSRFDGARRVQVELSQP